MDAEAEADGVAEADPVLALGLGCAPSGTHALRLSARAAAKTAVTAGVIVRRVMCSRVRGAGRRAGSRARAVPSATRLSA
ncbi:hypothetical protein GCM10009724_21120 [Microbacterium lacticum]|nr:hypothetical protein MLA01_21150 [Microbacterium lacticum]GGI69899.1 hypothetical protein GCM10009724_21120 [Microbacterium lacticum]